MSSPFSSTRETMIQEKQRSTHLLLLRTTVVMIAVLVLPCKLPSGGIGERGGDRSRGAGRPGAHGPGYYPSRTTFPCGIRVFGARTARVFVDGGAVDKCLGTGAPEAINQREIHLTVSAPLGAYLSFINYLCVKVCGDAQGMPQ